MPNSLEEAILSADTLGSVDRCPVTGRIIPELSVMAQVLLEHIEMIDRFSTYPQDILTVAHRTAAVLREYALVRGIPFAVRMFQVMAGQEQTPVFMVKDKHVNDQRGNDPDDRDSDCVHKGTRNNSGDVGVGYCEDGATIGVSKRDTNAGNGGFEEGNGDAAFPSGRMCSLSRRDVAAELREHLEDLRAFRTSYEIVRQRVQSLKDEGRMMKLVSWSGTSAVMGSMEMAIHAIERVIAELRGLVKRIDSGDIPNSDEVDHV